MEDDREKHYKKVTNSANGGIGRETSKHSNNSRFKNKKHPKENKIILMTEPQNEHPVNNVHADEADKKLQAIHIDDAMRILSMRQKDDANRRKDAGTSASCPCGLQKGGKLFDMTRLRGMGQVLSVVGGEESEAASVEETREEEERNRKKKEQLAKDRYEELSKLSTQDLISVVMKAQEERTRTYTQYNKDLDAILQTHNIGHYVTIVAQVTAVFSVQSDVINTAKRCIAEIHDKKDIEALISSLQSYEKEKLSLTAALHLERIREDENKGDQLLLQGISSLRNKIFKVIGNINDCLEELRYERIDLDA